jgi:hypothetical protein
VGELTNQAPAYPSRAVKLRPRRKPPPRG